MIIADTSGLLALFNRREPAHDRVAAAVASASPPLIVSPFVIAELDSLLATRVGVDAELLMLRELTSPAYEIATLDGVALAECAEVVARYPDQEIGVTDASLVVLAHRYGVRTLLTLDERHFTVVRPIGGGRFKLLGPDQP